MLHRPHFEDILTVLGAIWIGGYGFVMFRYPELLASLNARFGMKSMTGPRYISLIRKMGIFEMILAALGVVGFLARVALGAAKF